jgi:hypothetical protein
MHGMIIKLGLKCISQGEKRKMIYTPPKYYKYKNADPSTERHASRIQSEILDYTNKTIKENIRQIYNVRYSSVLGIDLKHAVIRKLLETLKQKLIEIDQFESQNSDPSNLSNYPFLEPDQSGSEFE